MARHDRERWQTGYRVVEYRQALGSVPIRGTASSCLIAAAVGDMYCACCSRFPSEC